MSTIYQLLKRQKKKKKKFHRRIKIRTPALKPTVRTLYGRGVLSTYKTTFNKMNSQKAGKCKKTSLLSPKKPNSAKRRIARVELSNGYLIVCFISGQSSGHGLDLNSRVLIRGGRTQDLPGVHYKIIRGKMDCKPDFTKNNSRSKYGVPLLHRPEYISWVNKSKGIV